MEESYICQNCGSFGSSRNLTGDGKFVCPQCGHRSARSRAGIRLPKLRFFVITAVILTGLGFGMFLFGVPSELRSAIRPVTETLNFVRGNDLDRLKESGFKECEECDLSGADLTGANLSGADLRRAWLPGATLNGADLRGADLSSANLDMANLRDANLAEANVDGVIGADFTGALNVPGKHRKTVATPNLTETSKPASETEAEERICFDFERQAAWDNYTTFTRIEGTNGDDQITFGPGDDGLTIQQCFTMGNQAKYKLTSSPGSWQIHDNGRSLKLDDGIGDGDFNDNVITIPSGKGKFTQEGQTFYYTRQ